VSDGAAAKAVLADLAAFQQSLRWVPERRAVVGQEALARVGVLRRVQAQQQLAQVPVSRLRETAKGLRIDAVEKAGITTIGALLGTSEVQLQMIEGVGDATARQILAAARQLAATAEASAPVRFDVESRPPEQAQLLDLLRRYATFTAEVAGAQQWTDWLAQHTAADVDLAKTATKGWLGRAFTSGEKKDEAGAAVDRLRSTLSGPEVTTYRQRLQQLEAWAASPTATEAVWQDHAEHAAELLAVLDLLSGGTEAGRGALPEEIVERVQAQDLDTSLLKATLRGYQAFGAKYALAQQRTIIGDEMGLGKTVEALAVLAHLMATGSKHALVVCPASVVANWRNEVGRHTELTAHVVHGSAKDEAWTTWLADGGVAITTYAGLSRLDPAGLGAASASPLPALVVDEAHYVKHPQTQRSQAVARWAATSQRVIFLSGTPMENRVEEFKALVGYLQPEVAQQVTAETAVAGAQAFQAAVAPVYLRRNQVDVLDELPDQIASLDWVDPTDADRETYRAAVVGGTFAALRQAAYRSIPDGGPVSEDDVLRSAKASRLADILEEAANEDLKVIVFSFFREVLDRLTRAAALAVPGGVFGPITGNVAPAERQALVDALTAHEGPGVLVAQIEAGGVGLNIQAASVVVLAEPQWKPTVEAQAIARAHRMGQVRRVQVHRLLLEDTVDQRILAILAGKQELIEQYVKGSAIKDATPDAIDISDLGEVERVVDEVQAEALILEAERRRLGVDGAASAAAEEPA